jgi:hypothetical protein
MTPSSLPSWFRASSAAARPIRVGLIVDRGGVDRASASIVRDLAAASFVRMLLVFVVDRGPGQPTTRFGRFRAEGGIAFALYATLDQLRAGVRDDPRSTDDVGSLLTDLPSISLASGGRGVVELDGADMDRVRAADLDVIVDLGSARLRGAIGAAARHGVWAIRPGTATAGGAAPPASGNISTGRRCAPSR